MDRRLRAFERAYRESGGIEDHARYLREALRCDLIDKDRIALCAFLGHGAAQKTIPECVRNDRIIYFDRAIPNIEVLDIIDGLALWGPLVLLVGAVGVCKPIYDSINDPEYRKCYELCSEYVDGPSLKKRKYLQNMDSIIRDRSNRRHFLIWNLRDQIIRKKKRRYKTTLWLAYVNLFDDNAFMNALRGRIYPWVLREFA